MRVVAEKPDGAGGLRRLSRVAVWAVLVVAYGHAVSARGNVNVTFGPREYTDGRWDTLDEQGGGGFWVDFAPGAWPVNIAISLYSADAQGLQSTMPTEPELEVEELAVGAIWYARPDKRLRPFVGGGLTLLEAKLELGFGGSGSNPGDKDRSTAVYPQAGFYYRVGRHWNFGLELRGLGGSDLSLFDQPADADYGQASFLIGWGW